MSKTAELATIAKVITSLRPNLLDIREATNAPAIAPIPSIAKMTPKNRSANPNSLIMKRTIVAEPIE